MNYCKGKHITEGYIKENLLEMHPDLISIFFLEHSVNFKIKTEVSLQKCLINYEMESECWKLQRI